MRDTDTSIHVAFYNTKDTIMSLQKSTREWEEISVKLQLREIPEADLPQLLHDCLLDRATIERKARKILNAIDDLESVTEWWNR